MKSEGILLVFVVLLSASMFVVAKPDLVVTNTKSGITLTIPAQAVEVTPGVFSLGEARNVDGRIVEGIMFIHYKRENAKPPWAGGGNGGGESTCFAYLAKGAKWKTLENWIVNPANSEGLSNSFVLNNLAADIQKWEDASDGVVDNVRGADIIGEGSSTSNVLVADTSSPDNLNEVYFGDVGSSGAIAVTIVWGIFSGPPNQRELVEWDQIYDQVDFNWSSLGEAGKMDFENIATHELGHSVGMGHPENTCIEETMYAFANFGETKKRDLHTGDVAGVNSLY